MKSILPRVTMKLLLKLKPLNMLDSNTSILMRKELNSSKPLLKVGHPHSKAS